MVTTEITTVPSVSLARSLIGLRRLSDEPITVGGVVERLADHSAALVLLLAGLLAVLPSPGLPVGLVFGSIAALVALRTAWRPGPVYVPPWLARRPLPRAVIDGVARSASALVRRIERRTRPRLGALARGAGASLGYLMIALQAVLVALPVPFGNTVPGVAIVLIALGLARGDGAVVAVGHLVGAAAVLAFGGLLAAGIATVGQLV
jgi:hypothetical protein